MRDKEIMTLEKSLFILRRGSAEGEHKYFEAITIIENEINRQKAEIERLEAEIDKQYEIAEANVRAEIASGGTSCHWCEDKVRAEAYKEFAERLKKELSFGKYIQSDQIDNLLKEMESDN